MAMFLFWGTGQRLLLLLQLYCIPTFHWKHVENKGIFWHLISSRSDTLIELGKVYLDLGYLTQSLQAHNRALHASEALLNFNSDKPNLQVNLAESSMCSKVAFLLALQWMDPYPGFLMNCFVMMYIMCCAVSLFRISWVGAWVCGSSVNLIQFLTNHVSSFRTDHDSADKVVMK